MSSYSLYSLPKSFRKHLKEVTRLEELTFTPCQVRNGTYIKLTIKSEGFTMTAYQTEGIDDDGNVIRLSFYNLPTTGTAGTIGSNKLDGGVSEMMESMQVLGKTVFKPGTVIYIKDPWLKMAMDGGSCIRVEDSKDIAIVRDATRCYNCDRSESELSQKLSRCSRCGGAFYCSRKCQTKDWKAHKMVCHDDDSNKTHHSKEFEEKAIGKAK